MVVADIIDGRGTFYLNENVNCKNCVHWEEENPHGVASVLLCYKWETMLCDFGSTFILGLYFFVDDTSRGIYTFFSTGALYRAMLENYVIRELQQRNARLCFSTRCYKLKKKCCNSTLVIEWSRVTLQFRGHFAPPTSPHWIFCFGVIWSVKCIHQFPRICQMNWKMP